MREVDEHVRVVLNERVKDIEKLMEGDCIFYYGPIIPSVEKRFREFIEKLKNDDKQIKKTANRIIIFLNTPGGSAETVEKLVIFQKMTTHSSSIVAATSNIDNRVSSAILSKQSSLSDDSKKRISEVQQKIDSLASRGLLKRQMFSSPSKSEMEKYLNGR